MKAWHLDEHPMQVFAAGVVAFVVVLALTAAIVALVGEQASHVALLFPS